MSSAGRNTRISGHRGHKHSRAARHRADIESSAHFDPHCSEDFDDLSLLPLCTQILHMRFDDPSSSETSISADRGSDFPHAPGAAASLTSFSTNKNQPPQPLQMLPTLSFQNVHNASAGAADTSPTDHANGHKDRRQCKEKPECSQQDCHASGDIRSPPWSTMNYPLSSVGSHNVALAPSSSSLTASCFSVGPNGVSGGYSDFTGGVSGAAGCGDGALAAAAAWPDCGGGGSARSPLQRAHHSSNVETASTGDDGGGNVAIADGNEYAILQPQLMQMLLQQQQQGTAPPNTFMPSSSPRTNTLKGLMDSSTAGSAPTMSAISACLMQLMSGNGGNEAEQTTANAPLQQLFALNPLPPPSPSNEPAPRAPQSNSIIDSDSVPTVPSLGTPGTRIVYAEAQIRGNTATKCLASAGARGCGSNNPPAASSGSLGQTSLHPYYFGSPPPPAASRKDSEGGVHINTLAQAALLTAVSPLHHAFSPPSPSSAAALPMLSAGMYSPFTGAVPHSQPGFPPPPLPTAAQSQLPLKPTSRAGNRHGSRGHGTAPATENHNTSAGGSDRNRSRRQQVDEDGHASSRKGAAAHTAGDAHAEPKNGANFVVGAWYEGVVKRYNPLRGFGFLTCTHQLRFDLRACERACTRHADAVHEKQQQRDLEKATAAATSCTSATLQSVNEGERAQAEQQLRSLSNKSVLRADDTSTAPLLASMDSVKESDICLPHNSVATEAHREGDTDAAAPAATTGTKNAEVADAADATVSSATVMTSTGKAHGTVVYSTMQWYLHMMGATGKQTSAQGAVAAREAEDDADEGKHSYRASFEDLGKLEREPAQLGDIFVHHSCISMDGFRVFVQGTAVRFSVAVLMDTVQAVDVIPLGPEWEKPLSPEALAQPPLYKVTPTAATVLRYHHLEEQRDDDTGKKSGGGPKSCVGGISVQWADMAVIPSPAIPNSVEGQSGLLIVRVPPKTGPISSQTTVTSTRSGATPGPAAMKSASATTTATGGGAETSQSTNTTEHGSAMPNTVAATGAQVSDASTTEPMCTGAKEALRGGPQLLDVVHPDSIAATFLATDREDQRALQGKPDAPAITPATPASPRKCNALHETTMRATEPSVPAAEVESLANRTSLENVPKNQLSRDPSAFSGGWPTSSKNDLTSGHGSTGGTGMQTSGRDSRNVTMTTATATNPEQSSDHNTGSHSQALPNSIHDLKDSRSRGSGTIPTDMFGDCEDLVLSGNMDEQAISSFNGCGAGHKADKDHCEGNERAAGGAAAAAAGGSSVAVLAHPKTAARSAAAAAQGAAPLPANGDFSESLLHDDAELSEVLVRSHSGSDSEEDEKDSITTTPSVNTIPELNLGPAPDWTEMFNLKIANERVKDIVKHKTDFKLLPHHSVKITAAAATPNQMSGGGSSFGAAALVSKVVPLSAVCELDSSSSRGVEEDEGVAEAGGCRSAPGNCSNRGDPVGRGANPSSSQPLMRGGDGGQTGTAQLTQHESSCNGHEACPRTGKPKKSSSADGQEKRLKDKTVPAFVMVDVANLPPKLAAQVPRGVTIIALLRETVKDLKIKTISVSRDASRDPASPCLAEAQSAVPVAGGPRTSGGKAHVPFHGPAQAAGGRHVFFSSAARRPGGNAPAHGHAESADSEFYRKPVVSFDTTTTSIGSVPALDGGKCGGSCSPENGRHVFPFTLAPPQSQQVCQPLPRTSMERKPDSMLNKSSRGNLNTFKTSSHSVPMPQSIINVLSSPWIQDSAAPSQSLPCPTQQQPPQHPFALQQQLQRSTPSGSQLSSIRTTLGHASNNTLSQQQREPLNPVFASLNSTAALQAATRIATGSYAALDSSGLYPSPCISAGVGMGTGPQPSMWAPSHALAPAQPVCAPPPPPVSSPQTAPSGTAMSASPRASSQWRPSQGNWWFS